MGEEESITILQRLKLLFEQAAEGWSHQSLCSCIWFLQKSTRKYFHFVVTLTWTIEWIKIISGRHSIMPDWRTRQTTNILSECFEGSYKRMIKIEYKTAFQDTPRPWSLPLWIFLAAKSMPWFPGLIFWKRLFLTALLINWSDFSDFWFVAPFRISSSLSLFHISLKRKCNRYGC